MQNQLTPVLSLPEAEALVERTKAAIPKVVGRCEGQGHGECRRNFDRWTTDRKRLDLTLEGLRAHTREHYGMTCHKTPCADARRYSTLIVDTAALYGQTP